MPKPGPAGRAAMGRTLRAWRGTRTLADVTADAGLNVDTLSDLEAGKTWPRNKTLRLLEGAYGKAAGELDRIAEEADAAERSPPSALDAELGVEKAAILRDVLREMAPDRAGDILARAEERFSRRGEGDGG